GQCRRSGGDSPRHPARADLARGASLHPHARAPPPRHRRRRARGAAGTSRAGEQAAPDEPPMNERQGMRKRARGLEEAKVPPTPQIGEREATPYEQLVHAAQTGQLESLVRQAKPRQPIAMVTVEEREAALRASG